jgi:hypothetical protein
MSQKTRRKVALGSPMFPQRPPLSPEEKAKRKAENEAFSKRCRVIFDRVYPELVAEHYDWSIMIEPDSGDYFIDILLTLGEVVSTQTILEGFSVAVDELFA